MSEALAGILPNARGEFPSRLQAMRCWRAGACQRLARLLVGGLLVAMSAVPAAAQETSQSTEEEAPARVYQAACPALLKGFVEGKILPPIEEGECGENSPLEVIAFEGYAISAPVTLNCRMAETVYQWLREVDAYAQALLGAKLARLDASTHYQCRRRNNAPTGKISEHGFANALDVIGFTLEDGQTIRLEANWGPTEREKAEVSDETEAETGDADAGTAGEEPEAASLPAEAAFLRQVRDRACTHFSTVLSPETNALHADHFHLDLGCHGRNCTYLLCE